MLIRQIPIRNSLSNYMYLLACEETLESIAIDPLDHALCLQVAKELGWSIKTVANTHHHHDHIGGNGPVIAATGAQLVSHIGAMQSIPNVDRGLQAGDTLECGEFSLEVMDTPGHTMSHICLYFPGADSEQPALFCGDTLFSAGCGRLFEGTPQQMYTSLAKLTTLPADTEVFCAHEYTMANIAFAETVEPNNQALVDYKHWANKQRKKNTPTLPSSIQRELAVNPFLRCHSAELVTNVSQNMGSTLASEQAVFASLRSWKDNF